MHFRYNTAIKPTSLKIDARNDRYNTTWLESRLFHLKSIFRCSLTETAASQVDLTFVYGSCRSGKAQKVTVKMLKEYCEIKGLDTKGLKKDDLVKLIASS